MLNSSISEIPLAPQPLLDALAQQPSHHAQRPQGRAPGSDAQSNPEFEQLLAEVSDAGQGQRNDTFNRAAFRAAQLAGAGKLDRDEAEAALTAAALDCGLSGTEITRTLESAFEAGMAQPRERDLRAERPVIELESGNISRNVQMVQQVLLEGGAQLYDFGGSVFRLVVDKRPNGHGGFVCSVRFRLVDQADLAEIISIFADVRKWDARRGAFVACNTPKEVLAAFLAGEGRWKLPKLRGAENRPIFRQDGTIFMGPGYDEATRIEVVDCPPMPHIPERPSKADALAGLGQLDELLSEFPLVDGASHSVALSAIITAVARSMGAVMPAHVFSAPAAGSGKSLAADIVSMIATGERPAVLAAGHNEEEMDKRLGGALQGGRPLIVIDNVNGPLGGDFLCQLIERQSLSIRPLGTSRLLQIENPATIYFTGNNIRLVGDLTRRVLPCFLDPKLERPELRIFAHNPLAMIQADRGRYLAAALTIVRAYIVAGRPGKLPPLASFEVWSDNIRSALVWLGRDDPLDTMEAARGEDPVTTSLRMLLAAWHEAVGDTPKTTGEIKEAAESVFGSGKSDLEQALIEVAEGRMGEINAKRLGHFLTRHNGRIVDGLRLHGQDDGHSKQKKWSVRHV